MEESSSADYDNPDEWELVNDAGFVFKRRKRSVLDLAAAPAQPDPAEERKRRRGRKKRTMLKLRERYLKEIGHWEVLSNTLKAMEKSSSEREGSVKDMSCDVPSSSGEPPGSNSGFRGIVDDLLRQVEKQEAIIRDVSNLCDLAEGLCSARDERLKQNFSDLMVWEPSPSEIMGALCER